MEQSEEMLEEAFQRSVWEIVLSSKVKVTKVNTRITWDIFLKWDCQSVWQKFDQKDARSNHEQKFGKCSADLLNTMNERTRFYSLVSLWEAYSALLSTQHKLAQEWTNHTLWDHDFTKQIFSPPLFLQNTGILNLLWVHTFCPLSPINPSKNKELAEHFFPPILVVYIVSFWPSKA